MDIRNDIAREVESKAGNYLDSNRLIRWTISGCVELPSYITSNIVQLSQELPGCATQSDFPQRVADGVTPWLL